MCVEFLKRKDGCDRVVEVQRISQDGMKVTKNLNQFNVTYSEHSPVITLTMESLYRLSEGVFQLPTNRNKTIT